MNHVSTAPSCMPGTPHPDRRSEAKMSTPKHHVNETDWDTSNFNELGDHQSLNLLLPSKPPKTASS